MARSLLLLALAAVVVQGASNAAPGQNVSSLPAGDVAGDDGNQSLRTGSALKPLEKTELTASFTSIAGIPDELSAVLRRTNKTTKFMDATVKKMDTADAQGKVLTEEEARNCIKGWLAISDDLKKSKTALEAAKDVLSQCRAKLTEEGETRPMGEDEVLTIVVNGEETNITQKNYEAYRKSVDRLERDVGRTQTKIDSLLSRKNFVTRMLENAKFEHKQRIAKALEGLRAFGDKMSELLASLKQKLTPGEKIHAVLHSIRNIRRHGSKENLNPAEEPVPEVPEPVSGGAEAAATDDPTKETNLGEGGVLDEQEKGN